MKDRRKGLSDGPERTSGSRSFFDKVSTAIDGATVVEKTSTTSAGRRGQFSAKLTRVVFEDMSEDEIRLLLSAASHAGEKGAPEAGQRIVEAMRNEAANVLRAEWPQRANLIGVEGNHSYSWPIRPEAPGNLTRGEMAQLVFLHASRALELDAPIELRMADAIHAGHYYALMRVLSFDDKLTARRLRAEGRRMDEEDGAHVAPLNAQSDDAERRKVYTDTVNRFDAARAACPNDKAAAARIGVSLATVNRYRKALGRTKKDGRSARYGKKST